MKNFKYLLLLFLTSCTVGPDYQTPNISMPSEFIESHNQKVVNEIELKRWWTTFNDPLLDIFIHEALSQNFDLLLAIEKVNEARLLYQIQTAELLPKMDFDGECQRLGISENLFDSNMLGPSTQGLFRLGFDASWEIDIFGKRRREKETAFYEYEAEIENARDIYITLLSEIATTYIEIRSNQQKIDLSKREIYIQKERLSLSEAKFITGLDSEIQTLFFRIALEESRSHLPILETAYRQAIHRMAVLLGKPPQSLQNAFEEHRPIPQSHQTIPIGLPSDLLRRRPDIRQAERILAAATANIGSAIADLFPRFSILGTFGFESNHRKNWMKAKSRTWSVGPTVNWPIIYFGRIRENIRAQTSIQKQALLLYEQTILTSLKDVENALVAYYQEEERLDKFKQQVEAAKSQYKLNQDLYLSGLTDFSKFLESDHKLLEAETNFINSQEGYSTKLVALYKAIGGEW